jgi:hypothetical protein
MKKAISKFKSENERSGGRTLRTVIKVFAAPPTGRKNLLGMLSQDGASLCPGLFSCLPSGKTAAITPALAPNADHGRVNNSLLVLQLYLPRIA